MTRIIKNPEWKYFDSQLSINFPWYTRPFLEVLINNFELSNWKVFEYGGGNSTIWWRRSSREVHSVDTNPIWSKNMNLTLCQEKEKFISCPKNLINEEKFDCIIIDGEPVEWRDDCTQYALESIKIGGILIIDNYEQDSVGLKEWPKTNSLLSLHEKHVFKEPEHQDWKTAFWLIK